MRSLVSRFLKRDLAISAVSQRDLFISYASEDQLPLIRSLSCALEEMQVTFWYDEERIEPGGWFLKRMDEGLLNSRFVLACMSAHYAGKKFTMYELKTALRREQRESRQVVIPVSIATYGKFPERQSALEARSHLNLDLENVRQVAAKIRLLVRPRESLQPIGLPIAGTNLKNVFFPQRFLDYCRDELSHRQLYRLEHILRLLRECGILVAHTPGDTRIEMNGIAIQMIDPANLTAGYGEPGIWPGDLVDAVYGLLSGGSRPPSATFAGVGPNYRAALQDLETLAKSFAISSNRTDASCK
jgi:hypothetical protein